MQINHSQVNSQFFPGESSPLQKREQILWGIGGTEVKLPTAISVLVLHNQNLIEPLRLFLRLKLSTKCGRLVLPKLNRTERKHFETLKRNRWIVLSGNMVFLRKFLTVQLYYQLIGKVSVRIIAKYLTDRKIFQAFLAASVFELINKKNRKKGGKQAAISGGLIGNSTRAPLLPKINYPNAVSLRYFASHLGVSIGKAFKLKQLAVQYKFIKVFSRKRELELYIDGKLISPNAEQLPGIYSDYPQLYGRVFRKNGTPFYYQPDQIIPNI